MRFLRSTAVMVILASQGLAQSRTSINLANQGRNADFAAFPFTRPITVGSVLPATCQVGQLFFNTAATAGETLAGCVQPNVWMGLGASNAQSQATSFNNISGGKVTGQSFQIGNGSSMIPAGTGTIVANALTSAATAGLTAIPISVSCDGTTDVSAAVGAALTSGVSNAYRIPDQLHACVLGSVITITSPLTLYIGSATLSCQMQLTGDGTGCIDIQTNNVTIQGAGQGKTIITQPNGQNVQTLINLNNGACSGGVCSGVSIAGLTISGNEANQNNTQGYFTGIRCTNCTDTRITDNEITAAGDRAIDLRGSKRVWVQRNYIHDTGVQIAGAARGGTVCGNALSIDGSGTPSTQPTDSYVSDNVFADYGDSVAVKGLRAYFRNNTILGAHYFGLTPCHNEGGLDATGSQGADISGNEIWDIKGNLINGSSNEFGITTPNGTVETVGASGATTYIYVIQGLNANSQPIEAAVASTTSGNALLSTSNYNLVSPPASWANVVSWQFYRFYVGPAQACTFLGNCSAAAYGLIGSNANGAPMQDAGQAANGADPVDWMAWTQDMHIHDNHFYGTSADTLNDNVSLGDAGLNAPVQGLDIHDNVFDAVYLNISGGKGTKVHNNTFRNNPDWITDSFVAINGGTTAALDWDFSNNTFYCNSGDEAISLSNISAAGQSSINGNQYIGCIRPITYQSTALGVLPVISPVASGAGSGSSAVLAPGSTNQSGQILLTTCATTACTGWLSPYATLTFSGTGFPVAPFCAIYPANQYAAALPSGAQMLPGNVSSGSFQIVDSGSAGLAANTTYEWTYYCQLEN